MPFSFNQGEQNQGATEVAVSSFDRKEDTGPDFVMITLIGVFVILLLITAGLFAYRNSLQKQIATKKADLSQYEGGLRNVPIDEIKAVSSKLKIVGQLVRDHPYMSTVFKILELSIEDGITYETLSLNFNEKNNAYNLNLAGYSRDYSSIYRQALNFKKAPYSKYISKVEVSPLKLPDDKGNIDFTMTMMVSIKGVMPESIIVEESNTGTNSAANVGATSTANTNNN